MMKSRIGFIIIIADAFFNYFVCESSEKVLKSSNTASDLKFLETTSFESGASTNSAISPFYKLFFKPLL
jgi:hypothetical protein